MRKYLLSAAVLSSLVLAAGNGAWAASIVIDDTNPNDMITISMGQFDSGSSADGTFLQSGNTSSGSLTVPEGATPLTFMGSWETSLTGTSTPFSGSFAEEALDPDGSVSDVLSYTYTDDGHADGHITGSFCSVSDNGGGTTSCAVPVGATIVGEGPNTFMLPALGGVWTSQEDVPEPASMALLGVGLTGLGLIRRRRR